MEPARHPGLVLAWRAMMRTRASRTEAVAVLGASLAFYLVALRLVGWRILRGVGWGWSDLSAYSLPKFRWVTDRILHGEVPLWNPLEFCGIPFLATMQPVVFFPPL